jgi:hypothetical protein
MATQKQRTAARKNVKSRSKMGKDELRAAIRRAK